jgi:tRNA threonylcarbamoyladenosine biosynthesis protein TsaE
MVSNEPTMNSAPSYQFASASEEETTRLGAALAAALEPGAVVALSGSLGAGKTRLVRAVAIAAGVDPKQVASPTFVLVHEYEGRWPIYHFDAYRLAGSREFIDLGAEEYLAGEGVCLIEWPSRVAEALPADLLKIEITITGETTRVFSITPTGPQSASVFEKLRARL